MSLFLCDHGKLKVKTKIMRKKIGARVQNFDPNKPRPASPKLQCYAKQTFNLLWPKTRIFAYICGKKSRLKLLIGKKKW